MFCYSFVHWIIHCWSSICFCTDKLWIVPLRENSSRDKWFTFLFMHFASLRRSQYVAARPLKSPCKWSCVISLKKPLNIYNATQLSQLCDFLALRCHIIAVHNFLFWATFCLHFFLSSIFKVIKSMWFIAWVNIYILILPRTFCVVRLNICGLFYCHTTLFYICVLFAKRQVSQYPLKDLYFVLEFSWQLAGVTDFKQLC